MIQKVSNSGPQWIDTGDSFKRESVSKSAADSFRDALVKRAKTMLTGGKSYGEIAADFKISEETLKNMMEEKQADESKQPTCECLNKQASAEADEYLAAKDAAQEAFNSLYGKRASLDVNANLEARNRIVSQTISDTGGNRKQMKSENSPTIFDPNKLERTTKEQDNGERIAKDNKIAADKREDMKNISRYQTISGEDIKKALKTTIQDKADSVSSAPGYEAHKYSQKLPSNSISIFDEKDFERAVPTSGEKMTEANKKESAEKKKDRTWTENGRKTVSTKEIGKAMIDSMLTDKE